MRPMLAKPITQTRLLELAHDDEWVMSPKIDGRRIVAEVDSGQVVNLWSRSGGKAQFPHRNLYRTLGQTLSAGQWAVDGEVVRTVDGLNHVFWFDVIRAGNVIGPASPFRERLAALETLGDRAWESIVVMGNLAYAKTTQEKLQLVQRVYTHKGEGIVARHLDGLYEEPKRPDDRSDTMLKFKFVRTADCIVVGKKKDGKDNLVLAVYRDGERIEVGEVTALAGNGRFADVGMVVEVRYRTTSPDGRLIEPTKPMIRTDKNPEDCCWDQLVFGERIVL